LELSKDKSIVVSKADKGNAVVVQDISDYKQKIGELISNRAKFERLDENPTIKRERNLNNYLRSLRAEFDKVKKNGKNVEILDLAFTESMTRERRSFMSFFAIFHALN